MDLNDTPAGAENAEAQQQRESYIPRARFDEVNTRMHDAERRLNELTAAQQAADTARLAEQEKWQELATKYKAELDALAPVKAQVDAATAAMQKLVETEMASLPEDQRSLVPAKYSPAEKLEWIAENKPRLLRPPAPGTDPGRQGDAGPKRKVTEAQHRIAVATHMTDEQYLASLTELEGHRSQE